MTQHDLITIVGKNGLRGTINSDWQTSSHDISQVRIQLENGQQILVPTDALIAQDDGSYYLPLSITDVEHYRKGRSMEQSGILTIPVIVEELDVHTHTVETGKVRITKLVREHEETINPPLLAEVVNVEHVAVNQIIDSPVSIRYEGETMIIPLLEEVLVVEKRLMLKEEVHITKHQTETHQPQTVMRRSEEIVVERQDRKATSGTDIA